jgi:hypothetical protein
VFEPRSRYAKTQTYETTDRRGRTVKVVAVPPAPRQTSLGVHRMRQGQRLDHLAAQYLGEPTAFWRICEQNGALHAEVLSEAHAIEIPAKER